MSLQLKLGVAQSTREDSSSGKDSPEANSSSGEEAGNPLTFLLSNSEEVEGCDQQGHQQGTHHAHRNKDIIQLGLT